MTKKVKFIGDPKDNFAGPERITVFGHPFRKNRFVDTPDDIAKRAWDHPHFVVKGQPDPSLEPKEAEQGEEPEDGSTEE